MTPDAGALNPLLAGAATERETAAIVIFAGRYYSGMPYEDPATVFLKVRPATAPLTRSTVMFCRLGSGWQLLGQLPSEGMRSASAPSLWASYGRRKASLQSVFSHGDAPAATLQACGRILPLRSSRDMYVQGHGRWQ